MSYAEAMERYGSDKPDLRFEMPITDVSDEMATLGLQNFPEASSRPGRGPGRSSSPPRPAISGMRLRKINEELWLGRIVPDARGSKRNLFTLKATDEAIANLVKKGASGGRWRGGCWRRRAPGRTTSSSSASTSRARSPWPWASCASRSGGS